MSVNRDMLDDILAEGYEIEDFLYALVDVIPENILERYLEKAASQIENGTEEDYFDADDDEDEDGLEKEYMVEVALKRHGEVPASVLRHLRTGVDLEDGKTAPAKVKQVSPGVLQITIHEGRNRQVRRMCDAVGFPVLRLVRTRIGPLRDRKLQPGEWRALKPSELSALIASVAQETPN